MKEKKKMKKRKRSIHILKSERKGRIHQAEEGSARREQDTIKMQKSNEGEQKGEIERERERELRENTGKSVDSEPKGELVLRHHRAATKLAGPCAASPRQ